MDDAAHNTSRSMTPIPNVLVIGCGYSGERIARHVVDAGGAAWGTTRRASRAAELSDAGIQPILADGPDSRPVIRSASDITDVIYSIPPGDEDPRPLLAWVRDLGAQRIWYLSATSVWGVTEGQWVDDDTPCVPTTERGRARLEHEERLSTCASNLGLRLISLRLPGIYGPGRCGRERLLSGQWKIVGDGSSWSNRIHVDDIAGAWAFLATHRSHDERRAWLVSDGAPFPIQQWADWACNALGCEPPPHVGLDEVPPSVRDFWRTDRRFLPAALFSHGWTPRWTDVFAGTQAIWRAEGHLP